jgi:hypothetical protein
MAKKVDDWVVVVIIILAALLVANIFVSRSIFRSISGFDGVQLGPVEAVNDPVSGLPLGSTGAVDYTDKCGPCSMPQCVNKEDKDLCQPGEAEITGRYRCEISILGSLCDENDLTRGFNCGCQFYSHTGEGYAIIPILHS